MNSLKNRFCNLFSTKAKERLLSLFHSAEIISFTIAVITFFLYLSYSQVLGGKFFFIEGDGFDISLTTLREFYQSLMKGESLSYSWSNSLGMNTTALYAYQAQLFSITSPLYLIFYRCNFAVITTISILIKVGLASLFFTKLVREIFHTPKLWSVIFGVFYANCAFQQYHVPQAFLWMDALFTLPLLIMLLYRFCNHGQWKALPFAYAYLFLTNFYMGYIVGFFTLLLLITYLLCRKDFHFKSFLMKLLQFGLLVINAILLSAFVLLPAFLFIVNHQSPDATDVPILYANILDLINQIYIGANATTMPYVYCGIPVLLLFPAFCLNKEIPMRSKLMLLLPLLLLILSVFVKPLYLFWHCGDCPDNFYYRFSFLISFLLCMIAGYEANYFNQTFKLARNIIISVIFITFYIIMIYLQPKLSGIQVNNYKYLAVNILFFTGFTFLQYCYAKWQCNPKYHTAIQLSVLLITSAELVINGYALYYNAEDTEPGVYSDTVFAWNQSMDSLLNDLEEDMDFYRISSPNDFCYNGDSYFGYHGISDFGSFENYPVRSALRHLGIFTSPRLILPFGTSDFSDTLLAVKYRVFNIPYTSYVFQDDIQATYIETDNFINLGFLVDKDTKDFTFRTYNAFENINQLASSMTGEHLELYEIVPKEQISFVEDGITISKEKSKIYRSSPDMGTLTYKIPKDERPAYVQFIVYNYSYNDYLAPVLYGGNENGYEIFGRLYASYLKQLMKGNDDQYYVTIIMDEYTYQETPYPGIHMAYYNEDAYQCFYNKLSANEKLQIQEYRNGYIHASLTVPDESYILYTSIPYEDGWKITANGKAVSPVPLLDGAFIGLELPPGEYDLEFTYSAPGAKEGIYITLFGCLLYAAAVIYSLKSTRRTSDCKI